MSSISYSLTRAGGSLHYTLISQFGGLQGIYRDARGPQGEPKVFTDYTSTRRSFASYSLRQSAKWSPYPLRAKTLACLPHYTLYSPLNTIITIWIYVSFNFTRPEQDEPPFCCGVFKRTWSLHWHAPLDTPEIPTEILIYCLTRSPSGYFFLLHHFNSSAILLPGNPIKSTWNQHMTSQVLLYVQTKYLLTPDMSHVCVMPLQRLSRYAMSNFQTQ